MLHMDNEERIDGLHQRIALRGITSSTATHYGEVRSKHTQRDDPLECARSERRHKLSGEWAALTTFAANGTTARVNTMAANVPFMPLSASARIPENTTRVQRNVVGLTARI